MRDRGKKLVLEPAGFFGLRARGLFLGQQPGDLFLSVFSFRDIADQSIEPADAAVWRDVGNVGAVHIVQADAGIRYPNLKLNSLAGEGLVHILSECGISLVAQNVGNPFTKNILRPKTEAFGVRMVYKSISEFRVTIDDEDRDIVGHESQLAFARKERCLGLFALADVLENDCDASLGRVDVALVPTARGLVETLEMNWQTLGHRALQLGITIGADPSRVDVPEAPAEKVFARLPKEVQGPVIDIGESKLEVVDNEGIADAREDLVIAPPGRFYLESCFASKASQFQMSLDAGSQFASRKWFEKIVVGAC